MSLSFSEYTKKIQNGNEVILYSSENGRWIRIPVEIYDLLHEMMNKSLDVEALEFDYAEDKQYFSMVIDSMFERGIIKSTKLFKERQRIEKIYFDITHRCNLSCVHCSVSAGSISEPEHLNDQQVIQIINKISAEKPSFLVLSGGEPLVRKNFWDIMDKLKNSFTGHLSIMSNGLLISTKVARKLSHYLNSISISIDGVDEETTSKIRGIGVYPKTIQAIKNLQENGLKDISISCVITKYTEHKLEQFYELANSLNVRPLLRVYLSEGRGAEWSPFQNANLETLKKKKQPDLTYLESINCTASHCLASEKEVLIDTKGKIFPCNLFTSDEFLLGNALDIGTLRDIIFNEGNNEIRNWFRSIHNKANSHCSDCPVNVFCWPCPYYAFKAQELNTIKERCLIYKDFYMKKVWGC